MPSPASRARANSHVRRLQATEVSPEKWNRLLICACQTCGYFYAMEDPAPAPQSSPWEPGAFVMPLFLLMPTCDAASIYGDQAAALHITGAGFVKLSPLFMLAAALFTPALLYGTRLSRWRHGIAVAMVILCLMSAPWLLRAGSSSIPLSRWLSHEETDALRQAFDIPCLFCSDSREEGQCLRVRRADDTAALRSYLQQLGVLATGQASP